MYNIHQKINRNIKSNERIHFTVSLALNHLFIWTVQSNQAIIVDNDFKIVIFSISAAHFCAVFGPISGELTLSVPVDSIFDAQIFAFVYNLALFYSFDCVWRVCDATHTDS